MPILETDQQMQGEKVNRPRQLTSEEVEGVRFWLSTQRAGLSPPVQISRIVPKLPSGWANGFKSTEFLTAVAGVVLAVAKGYGYAIPEDAFWSIVAYILGRSGMKAAAAFRSGVKQ